MDAIALVLLATFHLNKLNPTEKLDLQFPLHLFKTSW